MTAPRRAGARSPAGGGLVEGAELACATWPPSSPSGGGPTGREARPVAAPAEGDLRCHFTPGPVEHVLDLVLSDIVQGGKGPVKISFLGEGDHLRVTVRSGSTTAYVAGTGSLAVATQLRANADAARTITEVLGGRYTGDATVDQLEILLRVAGALVHASVPR